MSKIATIILGVLMILAGLWLGAWGQDMTGGINPGFTSSSYAWPAFITAAMSIIGGIVIIIFRLVL